MAAAWPRGIPAQTSIAAGTRTEIAYPYTACTCTASPGAVTDTSTTIGPVVSTGSAATAGDHQRRGVTKDRTASAAGTRAGIERSSAAFATAADIDRQHRARCHGNRSAH